MKNFEGYLKRKFGDSYILLAGGGHKELSSFAFRNTWNDFIHSGNEFTFASPQYSGGIWLNYRTASGSADGTISEYYFGNGAGGYADVIAKGFKVNGSNDSSVILAGGGTKALNDFKIGDYLPLTGGVMTGIINGNTGNGLEFLSLNTGSWKEGIRVYPASDNYSLISLQSSDSKNVFAMVTNVSLHVAYFDYYKDGVGKVIYMPYKDGTIALTSDLSSFLTENTLPARLQTYSLNTSDHRNADTTCLENGFYWVNASTLPPNVGDADIITVNANSSYGHQLAFKFSGGGTTGSSYDGKDLYTRIYSEGSWLPWYTIVTSGNWDKVIPYPAGFTSRGTWDWSGVTGTLATDWSVNGADIMFKLDGSMLNVITDGRFYQGIDIYGASKRVLDEYDISNTKWGDADTLDGYHASTLYTSIGDWISKVGNTKTVTVNGDANTYYPVVISATGDKTSTNIISVWKDLGSPTASYPGNHPDGTSSMWLMFEGRSCVWDGNGGYYRTIYKSQPYATLISEATTVYSSVSVLCIYLRGGGTQYNISTTYPASVTVYLSATNIGPSAYPANVAPRTDTGNGGIINGTFYGNCTGNADTVDGLHYSSFLRKDTNDSTPYQYSFTKTDDHAIQVGTIRGRAVGSQTGEFIHLYERVAIGSPNGWGSRNAPSYGLATYGGAWLATDTGNVGIGTTSPSCKLDVNGITKIGGGINNNYLHIYGSVTSTGFLQDGNDRPSMYITGNYPALLLLSGINNSRHGSTLSLGAFDGGNTSGAFKCFTFGTPGKDATWMDLGYGTSTNPHANGIDAYVGTRIVRFNSDASVNFFGGISANGGSMNNIFLVRTNSPDDASWQGAAMQIREYAYTGCVDGTDTWARAPRLAWHWSCKTVALIGLASNGQLYEAPFNSTNFYRLVYEAPGSTWNININGSASTILSGGYSATDNTVAGHKAGLVNWMNTIGTGVGAHVIVGASIISQWDYDSATYYDSSVYAFIKIGGGYAGSTYGLWMVSGYSTNKVGFIGRDGNTWNGPIRWVIDSQGDQAINGNLTCTSFVKSGTTNNYLLAGAGGAINRNNLGLSTTATSVTSLDVTYSLISVTISSGTSFTLGTSAAMSAGLCLTAIVYNSTGSTISIAVPGSFLSGTTVVSLDGSQLNCPAYKYLEISILCHLANKYVVSSKGQ